jgi:serine/threonine protein kinase
MPAPSTVSEFLDLVQKSGVVDEKKLDTYVAKLRASQALPDDPGKLAGLLVRDGLLTQFQAEQVLLGKWRRFTIGKYKVLERLGSGGMGSVYLCEHKLMRRRVAVKVLPAAKADDTSSLERFYREARAVAALDHPNIVRAYDIDQDDKLHFLVMEYVDGVSLQDLIKKSGPLDVLRAAHYVRQSAFGLQHAHETAGLIHRDIKPGNILVDRNGVVKVLDMGLARFFNDEEDILTKKYDENVLGTADYLAPEQALDSHNVDIRADIYSLGGTFYFCLTGRTPFNEGTVAQKLIWHQTRQPKPIRSLRPEVPEGLVAVLEKMMAKDPAQRYQTPAEVAEALAPWTETPIPPPPESEMPRLCPAALGNPVSMSDSNTGTVPLAPGITPPAATRTWQVSVTPSPKPSANPPPGPVSPPPARGPATTPTVRTTPAPRPSAPAPQPPARPPAVPGPAAPAATTSRPLAPGKNGITATVQPAARTAGEAAAEDESAPWEQLGSADTADPAGRLDTAPRSGKKLARRTPAAARKSAADSGKQKKAADRGRLWLVVAVVLGVVLVAGGVGAYVALGDRLFGIKPPDEKPPLLVSRTQKGAFAKLTDALMAARPGDRIVLAEDEINEYLRLVDGKLGWDVTIEPEEGRKVTWSLPDKFKPDEHFVWLAGVQRLRLKNITFDGRNKTKELAYLTGKCPGLTLDGCQFQGFTRCAVLVNNCEGDPTQPVTLSRLDTVTPVVTPPTVEAALIFDVNPNVSLKINQNILVRDCRFIGSYKAPIQKLRGELALDPQSTNNQVFPKGVNNAGQPVLFPPK